MKQVNGFCRRKDGGDYFSYCVLYGTIHIENGEEIYVKENTNGVHKTPVKDLPKDMQEFIASHAKECG